MESLCFLTNISNTYDVFFYRKINTIPEQHRYRSVQRLNIQSSIQATTDLNHLNVCE